MDFLSFEKFLSIPVLIGFYYFGALIFPLFMWLLSKWLMRKYKLIEGVHNKGKEMLWSSLNTKQKIKLMAIFLMIFLFMELFWRMFFEFLIAYMQMRDALLQ